MRVATVYFGQSDKLFHIAKAYNQGVAKQGHDVQLVNGLKDNVNLFIYDYLILGTESVSVFSGRIDVAAQHGLKNMGNMSGKAAYAFLLKKGLWNNKSLQLWMKWLESCGLMLRLSDVISAPSEAKLIGERLLVGK